MVERYCADPLCIMYLYIRMLAIIKCVSYTQLARCNDFLLPQYIMLTQPLLHLNILRSILEMPYVVNNKIWEMLHNVMSK